MPTHPSGEHEGRSAGLSAGNSESRRHNACFVASVPRLAIFLLAFLAACAGAPVDLDRVRNGWLGATFDDAVARWGVPTRSAKLSDGRDAHTWVSEGTQRRGSLWPSIGIGVGSGGVGIGTGVTVGPGAAAVRCERTLIFRDTRAMDQTWTGDPGYCAEFTRS